MDVLIIESDAELATQLGAALRARGVGASIFEDGEAALERARQQQPAAVVLALELGDRPSAGFSWCNRFKRDEALRNVPLVLTSTLATAETFEHHQRLKTRADAYLHKPFAPDELLASLQTWLKMDAPPAGSTDALADELLGEEDLETIEADAVEGLDDLFADLGGGDGFGEIPELEKTVVAFTQDDEDGAPFPAVEAHVEPAPPRSAPPPVPADAADDGLEVAALRDRVAELEARLESDAREAADRMAELEAQVASLGSDLASSRGEAAALQERLEEAERELAQAQDEAEAARGESSDRAAQVVKVREEWERTAAELEQAAAELETARAARAEQDAQLEQLRAEADTMREQLRAEAEAMREELAQLRAEGDERLRTIETLRDDVETGRLDAELLQADLERVRSELETARDRQRRAQEAVASLQAIFGEN